MLPQKIRDGISYISNSTASRTGPQAVYVVVGAEPGDRLREKQLNCGGGPVPAQRISKRARQVPTGYTLMGIWKHAGRDAHKG